MHRDGIRPPALATRAAATILGSAFEEANIVA